MANLRDLSATFLIWLTIFDYVRPKNMDNLVKITAINMNISKERKVINRYHIEARKIQMAIGRKYENKTMDY